MLKLFKALHSNSIKKLFITFVAGSDNNMNFASVVRVWMGICLICVCGYICGYKSQHVNAYMYMYGCVACMCMCTHLCVLIGLKL